MYFGVAPLLLAAAAPAGRRDHRKVAFAAIFAGALVLSVHVPGVSNAFRGLPVLNAVNLNRIIVLLAVAGAVLAAYGLELLMTGTAAERRRALALAALAAFVPVIYLLAHVGRFRALRRGFLHEFPVMHHVPQPDLVVRGGVALHWLLSRAPCCSSPPACGASRTGRRRSAGRSSSSPRSTS